MENILSKSKVEPLLSTLGRVVRVCRNNQGMSQVDLGIRCGLHRTYISDIERGTRNMTLGALTLVAEGLGLQLKDLLVLALDKIDLAHLESRKSA